MKVRETGVLVVGGGAAAALAAISLADAGLHPLIVGDALGEMGRGVAYSTNDLQHRLNVPVARMSARIAEPQEFFQWVQAHRDANVTDRDFVPRTWYGDYLAAMLRAAVDAGRAELIVGRISRLDWMSPASRAVVAIIDDGTRVRARDVVLAIGVPSPAACGTHAKTSAAGDRYVSHPWAPGALDAVAAGGPRRVMLVGAGLTMVDVALTLASREPGVELTAVSRTGMLPAAHRTVPSPATRTPEVLPGRRTLAEARRIVVRSVRESVATTGDWRPGIDALRPVTSTLWAGLSQADRQKFLREDRRSWDVRRHRMAPGVARSVASLRASGQLQVRALGEGELVMGNSTGNHYDYIISCTGESGPLQSDPLLARLCAQDAVRPDRLGLGLDCDLDGHPMDVFGRPAGSVTVVGALRRGQLWESTAVPELRAQAAAITSRLADRARDARLVSA